jgi:hypothetical protein
MQRTDILQIGHQKIPIQTSHGLLLWNHLKFLVIIPYYFLPVYPPTLRKTQKGCVAK